MKIRCKLYKTCRRWCKARKLHDQWQPCPYDVDPKYAKPIEAKELTDEKSEDNELSE